LRHWDKAPFEPHSGHPRDVSYVVVSPRGVAAAAAAETLREVSAAYELCGLGQHRPLGGGGGGGVGDAGFFVYDSENIQGIIPKPKTLNPKPLLLTPKPYPIP